MARKSLLPGFGGADEVALTIANAEQEYDASACTSLAVQGKAISLGAVVTVYQSFDKTNWASVGTIDALGETVKLTAPLGLIKVALADSDDSSGSSDSNFDDAAATVTVVGFGTKLSS